MPKTHKEYHRSSYWWAEAPGLQPLSVRLHSQDLRRNSPLATETQKPTLHLQRAGHCIVQKVSWNISNANCTYTHTHTHIYIRCYLQKAWQTSSNVSAIRLRGTEPHVKKCKCHCITGVFTGKQFSRKSLRKSSHGISHLTPLQLRAHDLSWTFML